MIISSISFILLFIFLTIGYTIKDDLKCSWDNCPEWSTNSTVINVHLICHSHDDLANPQIFNVGVQYILSSVVTALNKNPFRRFSYAETGFLTMWLEDKNDKEIEDLNKLIVEKGQLELIGGGWTQPDEACTHYYELIDQYGLGLRKLANKYKRCGIPKIAWQIDPFGHSIEHANILIGYEALFFSRMHYLELEKRIQNKSLEITFSRGTYTQPKGFCFDPLCPQFDIIIDNPELDGYNIENKLNDFINIVNEQVAKIQKHNHVLITMGGDFTYSNAELWFDNLDKLILASNKITNIKIFYSTPSCYLKALHETTKPNFPKRDGDFFPYADQFDRYWTGYFSSKPSLKGIIRKSSSLLQVTRSLYALMKVKTNLNSEKLKMELFERSIALTTHHDAITGTSKEAVTQNYKKRLFKGWDAAEVILNKTFNFLIKRKEIQINNDTKNSNIFTTQKICRRLNESFCLESMSNDNFTITVLNGNGQQFSGIIRIPVNNKNIKLLSNNGQQINYKLIPVFTPKNQIISNNIIPAKYELIFKAIIDPIGFSTYFVLNNSSFNLTTKNNNITEILKNNKNINSTNFIENQYIKINFNKNGHIETFEDLTRNNSKFNFTQEFLYYENNLSGAYIFRPDPDKKPISFEEPIKVEFIKNELVQEARQIISPWVSQVVRLFEDKKFVEFEFLIGPIITNNSAKEIITRYSMPQINSNGLFWTDSNGRRNIQRKRNFNKWFKFGENISYPIAANYYPITSRIGLSDDKNQMNILTDRSQGGTSLIDGQIEIMVHRRCVVDDGLGVEEILDEPGENGNGSIIRSKHWFIFGPKNDEYNILSFKCKFAPNINLLTLKYLGEKQLLIRLEHIFQLREHSNLSSPININLQTIFKTLRFQKVTELMLAGNVVFNEVVDAENVRLKPMEIRTFMLTT
ncbi:Alpha-mannosidase [Meloidogyne graminicola]|uniref:Alpha-mannosidase n=1 Tax=Meloidogyne graminicola TaxID=189291 RepID=A0A8S9ZP38_9BILA|nr:Alpha-mannosidase [Meloidogyne graminicola]